MFWVRGAADRAVLGGACCHCRVAPDGRRPQPYCDSYRLAFAYPRGVRGKPASRSARRQDPGEACRPIRRRRDQHGQKGTLSARIPGNRAQSLVIRWQQDTRPHGCEFRLAMRIPASRRPRGTRRFTRERSLVETSRAHASNCLHLTRFCRPPGCPRAAVGRRPGAILPQRSLVRDQPPHPRQESRNRALLWRGQALDSSTAIL